MDTPAGVPCWHIHHDTLLEWSTEPLLERTHYIYANKHKSEHETRLRLMRPVSGELPKTVVAAGDKLYATREVYHTNWKVYDAARRAFELSLKAHETEIQALHSQECPDCPWDGYTIFP